MEKNTAADKQPIDITVNSGFSSKTTFLLVRHGETEFNRLFKLQGHTDTKLNKNGIGQARISAEKLRNIHIDGIYTSDLQRASQTAHIISNLIGAPVIDGSPDLREGSFGNMEGKTYAEISEITAIPLDSLLSKGLGGLPETEPIKSICDRAMSYLRDVAVGNPGKTFVVVTHGGVIRAVVSRILSKEFGYLYFNNGSIVQLDFLNEIWSTSGSSVNP